jgi:2-(1,2-epoxy-1,2-dihydrophenyl)acetyl-CoA isomerase
MPEPVEVQTDGAVTLLFLNRPEAYNALNLDMVESLARRLITLSTDPDVRGVVISGRGKAFCAGGDLKWATAFPHGPARGFHELAARFHQAVLEIRRMAKPVVAALNGVAAGGGFSLALACDFRVMARSTLLQQAYTSNGLCIDGGGTFTLPRIVGLARALEIAAFDPPISADQALAWGLATRVVDDAATLPEAVLLAHTVARRSLHAFGLSKQLLNDSFNAGFESQIERERQGICACGEHPDGIEGLRAFVEKRKPVFPAPAGT